MTGPKPSGKTPDTIFPSAARATQFRVRVDAERGVDGCREIIGAHRIFRRVGTRLVARAVDESAAGELFWKTLARGTGARLNRNCLYTGVAISPFFIPSSK